jgi:hypothetical protein
MRVYNMFLLSALLFSSIYTYSQTGKLRPLVKATRVTLAPDIDGVVDEVVWLQSEVATSFVQRDPVFDSPPRFNTEVRIIYDDKAIYVAAIMHDPYPDSIKKELAVRDSDGKNADYFYIGFDTWNNKQDAYAFGVSASGIQIEKRIVDETYDAVWESAVQINDKGWVAELRIPYSALRFPALSEQEWGLQIMRTVRRYRESDQWSLEPKDTENVLNYWGTLSGLQNINPPLRLSVLPYLSGGIQYDSQEANSKDVLRSNYNGGMDLKWGLNESFTLDMILLPDFSQVQSDAIENNLSPFEIVYDENRPFFNEGTDLFQKGDLFYSRRIGHIPLNYNNINSLLHPGEVVKSNPVSSKLINAVKLSGRTSQGLGIGAFNALTGNTYAVLEDTNKNTREILTDPLTNYNILVLDQNLPNNSSVYIINTNVTRPGGWQQSNVGGGGFKLSEKSNTFQFRFDLNVSKVTQPETETIPSESKTGVFYNIELQKTKGKFRFSIYQLAMDNKYNRNDLGVNRTNDWLDRGLTLGYNVFQPFSVFRYFYQSINLFRETKITTKENINTVFTYRFNTTFSNYLSLWGGASYSPFDRYDYYESRYNNRKWINPGYYQASLGYSSDYRKIIALDGEFDYSIDFEGAQWTYIRVQPIIRISDKFKISPESEFQFGNNDKGFVNFRNDSTFFGERDIETYINSISGEYMFSNKISLSIWIRHYWQKGEYLDFFRLTNEGNLTKAHYNLNHNYNFNYFNVDLVFGWEFSPGSHMNVVWKNAIQKYDEHYSIKYFDNFERMISSPQLNNLSVKVLYYLDYQMLKRKK